MRFSKILAEKFNISVRTAKKFIKDGSVTLDGKTVKKDDEYSAGEFELKTEQPEHKFELNSYLIADFGNIVYFDKPVNMHSERHKPTDGLTMSDIVCECYPNHRLISRLDSTTDGIIAAVRDSYDAEEIHKTYLAVVSGNFEKTMKADYKIDADNRKLVRIIAEHGGNMTVFSPVEQKDGFSLVRAEFTKASRHQLRASLAYMGHPILGDTAYGGKSFSRIMLHCHMTEIDGTCGTSRLTNAFISRFRSFIF